MGLQFTHFSLKTELPLLPTQVSQSKESVACDPDCDAPDSSQYAGLVHDQQSAYDLWSHAEQKVSYTIRFMLNLRARLNFV